MSKCALKVNVRAGFFLKDVPFYATESICVIPGFKILYTYVLEDQKETNLRAIGPQAERFNKRNGCMVASNIALLL